MIIIRTLEVNYARRAVTATQMYMFYIKPVIGVPEIGFSHTRDSTSAKRPK